jgi:hypothetical protein
MSEHENSSGFVGGLIFGLVIGAIIAVIIYRKDKGKTFDLLFKKIEDLTREAKTTKKPVILPKKIIEATTPKPVKRTPKAKLFKKA